MDLSKRVISDFPHDSLWKLLEGTYWLRGFLKGRLGGSVGKAAAFGSGHDLRVLGWSPASGSLLSREPASLPLSLPASLLTCDLSLSNE